MIAILGALVYVLAIFVYLYILFMGLAVEGQTPGKRMQGVKVTTDNGEPIGLGGAIVRTILQSVLNGFFYIGSLWMLVDSDKDAAYDKILNYKATEVPKGSFTPLFPGGKPF